MGMATTANPLISQCQLIFTEDSAMKLVLLLMVLLSSAAFAKAPLCVNVGTRSEGWIFPDGKLHWDKCSKKYAYCGAVGTRSEGWYAAVRSGSQLIGFANCSTNRSSAPTCVNVGTRSEGWQTPNGSLLWDKCSEKILACEAIGTRSEGWYAVSLDRSTEQLLGWAQCAKETK